MDPVMSLLLRIQGSRCATYINTNYSTLQDLSKPSINTNTTAINISQSSDPSTTKMPSSYQSQTFSSVSSSVNGQTTSHTQSTYSDNSGTRVHQTSQEPGQALRQEQYEIDNSGRRVADGSTSGSNAGRITDVSDEQQKENDRLYEERMEEEYAKREGGA